MAADGFVFARCIYDEAIQNKIMDEGISESLTIDGPDWWVSFSSFLGEVSAFFKHSLFQEEKEWRLVSPATSIINPNVGFRTGRSMIHPYLSISLGETQESVINHIVVGLCPHPALSENAIGMLLRNKGIKKKNVSMGVDTDVRISQVPYRNW
jgi:hypothetical protein